MGSPPDSGEPLHPHPKNRLKSGRDLPPPHRGKAVGWEKGTGTRIKFWRESFCKTCSDKRMCSNKRKGGDSFRRALSAPLLPPPPHYTHTPRVGPIWGRRDLGRRATRGKCVGRTAVSRCLLAQNCASRRNRGSYHEEGIFTIPTQLLLQVRSIFSFL